MHDGHESNACRAEYEEMLCCEVDKRLYALDNGICDVFYVLIGNLFAGQTDPEVICAQEEGEKVVFDALVQHIADFV